MAQTVDLWGATYSNVPALLVPSGNGAVRFTDTTPTTAIEADVAQGKIFVKSDGSIATGTGSGGGGTSWEEEFNSNVTIISDNPNYIVVNNYNGSFHGGETYRVTWNGTEYVCQTQAESGSTTYDGYYIGNNGLVGETDTGEPFLIYKRTATQLVGVTNQSPGQITLKIEKQVSGGATLITKNITANGTYDAEDDDADGYSQVTVNVPSGSSKNVQTVQSTSRRNNTALGSITSLTCSKAGTYDVYWTCSRSNTSQTWGSQLYLGGTAYGTENTTWSNHVQNNHLENVSISANQTVAVYGRSRSGYYIYAPQLTIVEK